MIPTSFMGLKPADTDPVHAARRRAAGAAQAFGGRNAQGSRIDFAECSGTATPSSGMGSLMDAYTPAFKAEMANREARAARLDKLPVAVARLATAHGVTSLPMLEAVAVIARACTVMGDNPAQVFPSDIARTIGLTTQGTEELLREAVSKGFIEERGGSYWRCRL